MLNNLLRLLGYTTLLALSATGQSDSGLQVIYGANGIQQLAYSGTTLENVPQNSSDNFHIWHMKVTDLSGKVLTGNQYGWGEVNDGRSWNAKTHTWTYRFSWGTIALQYVVSGNTLDMNVTNKVNAGAGVIFDGAVVYPLALHFPQLPKGFSNPSYEQLAFNSTGPSVTVADFGAGEVVSVAPDASRPLYTGFEPAGGANAYTAIISGTSLDSMATFFPHNDRPVYPGQTDAYTVSLRFAPTGTDPAEIAADAYASWAATWPSQLDWTDRRIIGTVFLASAAEGNSSQPVGYPNNPRRYFNESSSSDFDIRTPDGIARFQNRILQQARDTAANLQRLNAQGAITWDIEGQQYPHPTSYACSPDGVAQLAPEMESLVIDGLSPYAGMKLDDAYFRIIHDAGYRVGVCVRPQHFTLNADGTADQVTLPNEQVASEVIRKVKYAHDRWGATLFYIDSNVEANGAPLDAAIVQQVASAVPDSLVIPEHSTPKYYAYSAPFKSFIFATDLGTPSDVYNYYSHAFSTILVNDVDPAKLAQYRRQLTDSVRHGDILMVHADYWQANNSTIVAIYKDATRQLN